MIGFLMPIRNPYIKFMEVSIRTVIDQMDNNWELLIIKEKTDSTEYKLPDDKRIRLIVNDGHGYAAALNTGLRVADAEFLSILPHDDYVPPYAVQILKKYIEKYPDIGFFHSSRRIINDSGKFISKIYKSIEVTDRDQFKLGMVKHLYCFSKAQARNNRFDEELSEHGVDDWDFPWRMFEYGCKFKAIDECLFVYRDHRTNERLTTHVPRSRQLEIIRKTLAKHNCSNSEIEDELDKRMNGYICQAIYEYEGAQRNKIWRYDYNTGIYKAED